MKRTKLNSGRRALAYAFICFGSIASKAQTQQTSGNESNASKYSAPIEFIHNAGQWQSNTLFLARHGETTARIERDAISMHLRSIDSKHEVVRLRFVDAEKAVRIAGDQKASGLRNFFVGNQPQDWRSNVPAYAQVHYGGLYSGVDLIVRQGQVGFEYDLLLQPSADLKSIQVKCEGCASIELEQDGTLVLHTQNGQIRQAPPKTWEDCAGATDSPRLVDCRYVALGPTTFGFEAPERNPQNALTIDPGLEWSTYLGGSDQDQIHAVAVDPILGQIVVAGETASFDFPLTAGAYDDTWHAPNSAFVTRMGGAGTALVSSTFLGGFGDSAAYGLTLDAFGDALITGKTSATDFPTTVGAFDTSYGGGSSDGFFARIRENGTTLLYSTFVGGNQDDSANAVVTNGLQEVIFAGSTSSSDFPTTTGSSAQAQDAFVCRLSLANQMGIGSGLKYSTLLGGAANDAALAITHIALHEVAIAGFTEGQGFPITFGNAYDESHNGSGDAFLSRVFTAPAGSNLLYSTYLGGKSFDRAMAVAYDAPNDSFAIVGDTDSANFPTTSGAYDQVWNGTDVFITRFNPGNHTLRYSSFLGGSNAEYAEAIHLDNDDRVVAFGITSSPNFPTTSGVHDESFNGSWDIFAAALDEDGSNLCFGTFLGGSSLEELGGVTTLDDAYVFAGGTSSSDYPTTSGVFQETPPGNGDGFVSRLPALLQIDGFTTLEGPETGGTWIEITGGGFVEDEMSFLFGDVPAELYEVLSSHTLLVATPAQSQAGKVSVTISTPYASFFNPDLFEYTEAPDPPQGGGGKHDAEENDQGGSED